MNLKDYDIIRMECYLNFNIEGCVDCHYQNGGSGWRCEPVRILRTTRNHMIGNA